MMTGVILGNGFDTVNVPHSQRLEFDVALDTQFGSDDATPLIAFRASSALPGT